MEECGVKIHPNLKLNAVREDGFELLSSWGDATYQMSGFDTIVLVYGSVAQQDLHDQLKADASIEQLFIAGSAWLPRHMAEATEHGATIGLVI